MSVQAFMQGLKERNPNEPEFHQAVQEFVESVYDFYESNPKYKEARILDRISEPDRVFQFKIVWEDDKGNVQVNKAYRVQFNNAIGPYKGGLRFHPTVNLSVLKFLGFEQIFKNSLTGLAMGGGKGGSDFNPKGKSDREVMRFCQAFMQELSRHIGADTDVPAGDIGVGGREIGYLFGQYKKSRAEFTGVLTGKGMEYGGSLIRPEATGYGCVYFTNEMLKAHNIDIKGLRAVVSGSGNVAQYTIEKLLELGATVHTASDSGGYVYDKDGFNTEKLEALKELKNVKRGRISEFAEQFGLEYHEGEKPWGVSCDLAFPSATQNEIDVNDAQKLIDNGVKAVGEGANMPTSLEGIEKFIDSGVLFGPAKAANAGGVATSGLEMSQNSLRLNWSREEVDERLKAIMVDIHAAAHKHGTENGKTNYVKGANIAGFKKVADAMLAQGLVL